MNRKPRKQENKLVQRLASAVSNLSIANKSNKKKKNKASKKKQPSLFTTRSLASVFLDAKGKYLLALDNPFDVRAVGCRAPDPVTRDLCVPFRSRVIFSLTSSGSGGFAATFVPSATISAWLDGGATNYFSGTTFPFSILSGQVVGLTTQASLANTYRQVRVVAGGIRFWNAQAEGTATGNMIFAPVPLSNCGANQDTLNDAVTAGISGASAVSNLNAGSIGTVNSQNAALITLPGAEQSEAPQMLDHDVVYRFLPSGDSAYDWRPITNTAPQNLSWGNEALINNTTGLVSVSNRDDTGNCQDWTGLQVFGSGFPNSVLCIRCEMLLHMEGTPQISSGSGGLAVSAGPGNTMNLDSALKAAARIPNIIRTVGSIANSFSGGRIIPALMNGITRRNYPGARRIEL